MPLSVPLVIADAARTINQTVDTPWGQIMAYVFGITLVLCFTMLAIMGKLPFMKGKIGSKGEVQIGASSFSATDAQPQDADDKYVGPERRTLEQFDAKSLHLSQLVDRRRTDAINAAWAKQKAYADEIEDDFWPIMEEQGCDNWQIETAWSRLHMVLYQAADTNHILEVVDHMSVSPVYLQEKVAVYKRRYDKLLSRTGCTLPAFHVIEYAVRGLLVQSLTKFASIAVEEDELLRAFVHKLQEGISNEELKKILEETASRHPKEVV